MERYIGGEFWYDDSLICPDVQLKIGKAYFLNGGCACLQIICDYLKALGITEVLLPEYLCPTILECLDYNSIKYDFFSVNKYFKINLEDLMYKSKQKEAILFINYFGFNRTDEESDVLTDLKKAGKVLIEDNVQSVLNDRTIGSFSFNSFRKIVPYDGSFLYSDFSIDNILDQYINRKNTRISIIRKARELKRNFFEVGNIEEVEYLKKFEMSEEAYYKDKTVIGDNLEKNIIEHLNWKRIIFKRRENYSYLFKKVSQIPGLEVVFPDKCINNIPMGMPVYISNGKRDHIRKTLMEKKIFLPVHWDLRNNIHINKNKNPDLFSNNILTLVIDQRYGIEDMDHMAESIIQAIGD